MPSSLDCMEASAPYLVFDSIKGVLEIRATKTGIEIMDDTATEMNMLSFSEARHLHSWLGIVLAGKGDADEG